MELQPVEAVRVLVYRENEVEPDVLLLRRSKTDTNRPNEVDLPGGAVEVDETLVGAGVREVQEEAGIRLTPEQLQPVEDCTFTCIKYAAGVIITKHYFLARAEDDTLTVGSEHSGGFWLPLSWALKLVTSPHQKQALEKVVEDGLLPSRAA